MYLRARARSEPHPLMPSRLSSPCSPGATGFKKKTDLGPHTPPGDESSGTGSTELVVVVASSDGVVTTLCGPRRRNCGSFAVLAEGTALSIFELLGYRSSQVPCVGASFAPCVFLGSSLVVLDFQRISFRVNFAAFLCHIAHAALCVPRVQNA